MIQTPLALPPAPKFQLLDLVRSHEVLNGAPAAQTPEIERRIADAESFLDKIKTALRAAEASRYQQLRGGVAGADPIQQG